MKKTMQYGLINKIKSCVHKHLQSIICEKPVSQEFPLASLYLLTTARFLKEDVAPFIHLQTPKTTCRVFFFYKQTLNDKRRQTKQALVVLCPLGFHFLFLFVLLQEGRGSELLFLLVGRFGGRAFGRQGLFDFLSRAHVDLNALHAGGQLAHALDELVFVAVVVFAVQHHARVVLWRRNERNGTNQSMFGNHEQLIQLC